MIRSFAERIWNLAEFTDSVLDNKVVASYKCWREGHEWFSETDVCGECTRIVCVRCRHYAGTVKGQE